VRELPDTYTWRVALLAGNTIRPASAFGVDDGVPTWDFNPPLTAGEQTTLDGIKRYVHSEATITLAEWQAVQSDIDGLLQYQGLASPTLAQTVAAVKAQSRILKALLRS
jgi:hypothetical protein